MREGGSSTVVQMELSHSNISGVKIVAICFRG